MYWFIFVSVINVLMLAVLAIYIYRLRDKLTNLQIWADKLQENLHQIPFNPEDYADESSRLLITLDILNPVALVAGHSWIGGKFAVLTPGLMHRIVLTQIRDQLSKGMKENGVEADVRLVRLGH